MAINADNQHVLEDYFDQLLMPAGPEEIDVTSPVILLPHDDKEYVTALRNVANNIGARTFSKDDNVVLHKAPFKNI
ncbi:MAG: hypothetical protein RL336_2071 [Pseudomonadota bacterium]|jgi:hypothetical protein